MKVGFISRWDVADRDALSGMPASMWDALGRAGVERVLLQPPTGTGAGTRMAESMARAIVPPTRRAGLRQLSRRARSTFDRPLLYHRMLARATALSRSVGVLVRRQHLDALFGVCISSELFALETDVPIVYASDATARLINATYAGFARRPTPYHRASDDVERKSLQRVHTALLASEATLESVVRDYGVPRDRAVLAPMGANVLPAAEIQAADVTIPTRDSVELLVVASDPHRKQVDLCIATCTELVRRGVRARLHVVGDLPHAGAPEYVTCHGRLRLSQPADRALHVRLLQQAHLMLLPSLGEMYGIAPVEAAHFGRPSLVSDTGGLPTVVAHERSGLVLPLAAGPGHYADAIVALCDAPDRYRALSAGALHRAHTLLNWDAWGRTAAAALRRAADSRR